ncbi:MAG: hypothetical protein ACRD6N_04310 [Pyrinomonadaceae bacterium]
MILKVFYLLSSILTLVSGLWMLFFPLSWYTDFPAAISYTGPFNSHFVRDLGVTYIVVALAFGWCSLRLGRARPVHLGLTIFFTGHALIHIVDIATGRLPLSHWLVDAPLVFLPAVIMIVLAVPAIRTRLGERTL